MTKKNVNVKIIKINNIEKRNSGDWLINLLVEYENQIITEWLSFNTKKECLKLKVNNQIQIKLSEVKIKEILSKPYQYKHKELNRNLWVIDLKCQVSRFIEVVSLIFKNKSDCLSLKINDIIQI